MKPHKVSVIIPTYNMANYLGETIQDVLNQTYLNFEIIVVNDASTDHTDQVMEQFDDQRIKYIVHPENRYAAAARNTGIRASEGEYIAFVDADDKIHPEKLITQIAFLEQNTEVGLAYCSRIEIDQEGNPLALVPAPSTVSLKDLALGYPYAPSEIVMRREWAQKVGLFDESFRFHGEDPDFHMRLALQGCKMAGVKRVLNFRRLRADRVLKNLEKVVEGEVRAFENTFANPLCPNEVLELRKKSLGMIHRIFSFIAFSQNDTTLGQELLRKAIELDEIFFENNLTRYIDFITQSSVRSGGDHEAILRTVVQQLPLEFGWSNYHTHLAIGHGYLLRWGRDFLWERVDSGVQNFEKACAMNLIPDERFYNFIVTHLLNYESEFGSEAALKKCELFISHLKKVGNTTGANKLKGIYMVNRSIRDYRVGEFGSAIPNALDAIRANPGFLINRGVLVILIRSIYMNLSGLKTR
jgi:glycosyltransferase involved in cell wall biosynthesis